MNSEKTPASIKYPGCDKKLGGKIQLHNLLHNIIVTHFTLLWCRKYASVLKVIFLKQINDSL